MTTLQQRLRHPVGCTLEDRIAAADAIECDRAILAARTNIMNQQCAAMKLALSMLHFMNDNGYRLEECEQGRIDAAIAALEKEMTHENNIIENPRLFPLFIRLDQVAQESRENYARR